MAPAIPLASPPARSAADSAGRPLRIGLSARLMHLPPVELGFRNKTLQYLEQSMVRWLMGGEVLVMMLPALGLEVAQSGRQVSMRHYVDALDGLVLQGGADVSPTHYGQQALRPDWAGDAVRDRYELHLIEAFAAQGKPVLGICRGLQLINVAFGGTLLQDIATQGEALHSHVDAELYDQFEHAVQFEPGSRLAGRYAGLGGGRVVSIHHQAVDRLGAGLQVEARSSEDGLVEALRATGPAYLAGVQWHPEFHGQRPGLLSGGPLLEGFLVAARAAAG
jgi:putative glutamine amidotransferase